MTYSIAALAGDLERLGWKPSHTEFGRQSWTVTTTTGHATVEVRMVNNGVVGSLLTTETHSDDGDMWETEDVALEVGAVMSSGILPIHRPESEIASTLHKWARLIALEVER